jgi:hypothetical protein
MQVRYNLQVWEAAAPPLASKCCQDVRGAVTGQLLHFLGFSHRGGEMGGKSVVYELEVSRYE